VRLRLLEERRRGAETRDKRSDAVIDRGEVADDEAVAAAADGAEGRAGIALPRADFVVVGELPLEAAGEEIRVVFVGGRELGCIERVQAVEEATDVARAVFD